MSLLEVRDLRAGYAFGTVLHGVDLDLAEGGGVAVLGRNGVGKTTLIHALMGIVRPTAGSVKLDDEQLAGRRTDVLARAGMGIVPQGRRVFGPLTVTEHLELAGGLSRRPGPWTSARVLELFPLLERRLGQPAGRLSGGEQQMLAIARALLTNPRVLLLDEPSDGLAPTVVRQLSQTLQAIRLEGVGIVLVEQDLRLAFEVADDVLVMDKGQVVHQASVDAFRRDRPAARRLLGVV